MYIDVGTHINWTNEPNIPFTTGIVADLGGMNPGDHTTMGLISVHNGDNVWWSLNSFNIVDIGVNSQNPSTVLIDEHILGSAISQGITNSGLGQVNLMTDNSGFSMVVQKLQELIDKGKPKEVPPVVIPEVDDKFLIL